MTGFILLMQSCGSVEVSHGKIRVRPNGDSDDNVDTKREPL